MLLTITTTYRPATDMGFLLHKNPANVQSFSLSFGRAHVFYPEASFERCTAAMLLDVDTVSLVRSREHALSLDQYVNDRPYVASSFLSLAIAEVYGTALQGRCAKRAALVEQALPLQANITVVPCRGGEALLKQLFEPLGYGVTAKQHVLDEQHPEWGMSSYYSVSLQNTCRLCELLTHLYVLIPVLDDDKHYWIGDDEVEKLLRHGKGWLETHPERELIADRYLKHKRNLTQDALARLIPEEAIEAGESAGETTVEKSTEDEALRNRLSLHEQRLEAVTRVLLASGARRVLDLGCGEGRLLKLLLQQRQFDKIVGIDVSYRALERAQSRLHLDRLPTMQKERISLIHGALTYRDKRLEGYDAAAVVEVIEHLDPARLSAFERVLFEFAQPATVVITTPNAEYNVKFETLHAGTFRHKDHRFEWTRAEFEHWARRVADRFGYTVTFSLLGSIDDSVGAPSQMAVFTKNIE
ncbi:MAG TPA: 3' terminal RNA ribose 2'-O-methyltransferase Hen1 [Ktedonobacteraceae bacterium]|nr:3' terminal RNA ribose 2'-O-methyltransferase Hen1 [Ktedonobacteraceae bacterium]